jgi:hypothetical protein
MAARSESGYRKRMIGAGFAPLKGWDAGDEVPLLFSNMSRSSAGQIALPRVSVDLTKCLTFCNFVYGCDVSEDVWVLDFVK